ncbi:MAG TPA: SAM-dependent methyltransferase [Streptosporangiaceae bacterium]|nr:SAM-dependent methyltransferase [Streptosporangiaceae bacterium]
MADSGSFPGPEREPWPEIDTKVAHVARVYDYLLGGRANFPVDREAAQRAYTAWPGGLDGVRADARAHRAVLGRVVRYLAGEAGIRQFLDIGTGIPKENNTHEVAQQAAPEARIVYVDYDPIVLAHAHKLLTRTPEGTTAYIYGDLRDPAPLLRKAADTLDFSKPVAVMLFGVLHFFADAEDPRQTISTLTEALVPGSYLAITHLAKDVHGEELTETFDRLNQHMSESVVLRTQSEVTRFFDGLELVEPGVVQLPQWRPGPGSEATAAARPLPMWCGVGRNPDPSRAAQAGR